MISLDTRKRLYTLKSPQKIVEEIGSGVETLDNY